MSEEIIKSLEQQNTEVAIVDEKSIRDKIHVVRGVQVMLDFELAEIYGFTTSAFNQQVRRNIERFPDDFRFQLTQEEKDELSRSQNVILNRGTGRGSNIKYKPYAFTEQGVYMLMTVLKGETAVKQSIALIRAFKAMKDHIVQYQPLIAHHDVLHLSMQVSDSQQAIRAVQEQLIEHGEKLNDLFEEMQETVKRSEISPYLLDFTKQEEQREYLILNGQPAKADETYADETYIDIYGKAKKSVFIVDNYVSIKTLRLLQNVQNGVTVTVFSDNLLNLLHASDYADFHTEFPNIPVKFQRACRTTHDRFIVLDYGTSDERVFHCGASSKDAGVKLMTVISEMTDPDFKSSFDNVIQGYMGNPVLTLK